MKCATQGVLMGLASIFAVNGIILWLGGFFSPSDAVALGLGSFVASLVALRVWSLPEESTRSSAWWLLVALGASVFGAFLFWVDIQLGFIRLPIQSDAGILAAITSPWAVMVSAAFFPLFASTAVGSAVRAAWLKGSDNLYDQ